MNALPAVVAGVIAGPPLWSFMEYAMHRWLMHEQRGKNYASKEHLRHHASRDTILESTLVSWTGVAIVGLVVLPAVGWVAWRPAFGMALGLSWIAGYYFYEWVHWRAHRRHIAAGGLTGRYETWLRRHHYAHHFHSPMKNHGVTTPLWDIVFRTYEPAVQVRVPRRLAPIWLVDDDGAVLPRYREDYVIRGTAATDESQQQADWDHAFANVAPAL
jgi:sterol desaturase/sphingolipid hydroxylase (fatty acid hydroxylase superfamily)